jgi:hypothetical protein
MAPSPSQTCSRPSIHELTHKPYVWAGLGDWRNLPELPEELLALWRELAKNGTKKAAGHSEGGPILEGGRNNHLTSLAGTMRRRGMSEAAIRAVLMAENEERCVPPLSDAEVDQIAKSMGRYAAEQDHQLPPVEVYVEDTRKEGRGGNSDASHHDKHGEAADATEGARAPRIEVCGELPRIVSDAVNALQDAGAPIYVRGDALYRPVRIEAPPKDSDHVRRPIGAVVLRPVDPIWVRLQLASAAKWEKWNAKGKKMCPADPSKDVAQTVATQADLGNWDPLRGVVSHPVVTLDGRVISVGGYDRDTGLLIEITGDWPIPEAPTRDDAIDAWRRLKELLRYFPWVSGVDRAVALSMLLTAVARPALPALRGRS